MALDRPEGDLSPVTGVKTRKTSANDFQVDNSKESLHRYCSPRLEAELLEEDIGVSELEEEGVRHTKVLPRS